MSEEYVTSLTLDVEVQVNDPSVIARCVNNQDDWRDSFYDLRTAEEVIGHLVYNYVANGVEDIRRLDGWADVAEDAVVFSPTRSGFVLWGTVVRG
jgi:hypothetical protein